MKKIKHIPLFVLGCMIWAACNDKDFLDTLPKDELPKERIFGSYSNIQSYSWSFYEFLKTLPTKGSKWEAFNDIKSDMLQKGGSRVNPDYLNASYNIPSGDDRWTDAYTNIRKVNLLLDNLEGADISDEDKAHWRGVGLFFRAHEYFTLLSVFGGVPWIEHALTEQSEELYAPRDTRDLVADNILRDLQEAVKTIKEEGDGPNTINADVARALLSRFALFEGTWRKYHGLGGHEKFLNTCITASSVLINKYPDIISNYDHVYNSDDLAGKPGILLYAHYTIDVLTHMVSTNTRSTNNKLDITKKGIDKFLTLNGMPVTNPGNTQYGGDKSYNAEWAGRDRRLWVVSPPPYKVNGNGNPTFTHTGNPEDAVYFDSLEIVTTGFPYKNLPDRNWSGRVTGEVPNFDKLTPTQTGNGYRFWKIWNEHNYLVGSHDVSDMAIFRMGEIFLNYAEATYEMGEFDQAIADKTINRLRQRGRVAPLTVGNITSDWDPVRDLSVDPVLWEIRRERAVELLGDGFRREDLRRWKKMDYAAEVKLGRWVKQSDYGITISIQNGAPDGYVQLIPDTPPSFPDHYYLFPIPSDQMVLNPNLEQNPGW